MKYLQYKKIISLLSSFKERGKIPDSLTALCTVSYKT